MGIGEGPKDTRELIRSARSRIQASRLKIETTRSLVRASEKLRRRLFREEPQPPERTTPGRDEPPRAGGYSPDP